MCLPADSVPCFPHRADAPAWGISGIRREIGAIRADNASFPASWSLSPHARGLRLKDSINFAYAVGAKNTAHKIMEFNPDFKVLHFHANEPTRPHS
jgi:hypothetical protein